MRGWISRHPILSFVFGAYVALFVSVAVLTEQDNSTPITILALFIVMLPALLFVLIAGFVVDRFKQLLSHRTSNTPRPALAGSPQSVNRGTWRRDPPPAETAAPAVPADDTPAHPELDSPEALLVLEAESFNELCLQGLHDLGYHDLRRNSDRPRDGQTWTATGPRGAPTFILPRRFRTDRRVPLSAMEGFTDRRKASPGSERAVFMTTGVLAPEARNYADTHGIIWFDGDNMIEMAKFVLPALADVRSRPLTEQLTFCGNCGAEQMTARTPICSMCGHEP